MKPEPLFKNEKRKLLVTKKFTPGLFLVNILG
jgi:hypothetical protein